MGITISHLSSASQVYCNIHECNIYECFINFSFIYLVVILIALLSLIAIFPPEETKLWVSLYSSAPRAPRAPRIKNFIKDVPYCCEKFLTLLLKFTHVSIVFSTITISDLVFTCIFPLVAAYWSCRMHDVCFSKEHYSSYRYR